MIQCNPVLQVHNSTKQWWDCLEHSGWIILVINQLNSINHRSNVTCTLVCVLAHSRVLERKYRCFLRVQSKNNTVPTPDQIHREITNSARLYFSQGPSLLTMTKEHSLTLVWRSLFTLYCTVPILLPLWILRHDLKKEKQNCPFSNCSLSDVCL